MAPRRDWIVSDRAETSLPFRLTDWSAWTPECGTKAQWLAWAGVDEFARGVQGPAELSDPLPRVFRRRANTVGRAALSAATALAHLEDARYVVSTRHGEFERMVSILEALTERETPSPAEFSMSVEHAIVGLLSIAAKNTQGHCAVSAGPESFCYGMLEAAACFVERPDQPVIFIYYDELPGGGFADLLPDREKQLPIVVALGMSDIGKDEGDAMTIAALPRENGTSSACHARDFIRFVLEGAREAESGGNRMAWRWRRA